MKYTIYSTAKGGNISGGLPGVKFGIHSYMAQKNHCADAIKTLLVENDITVFSAAVVSNGLTTNESFKVIFPAD